MPVATETATTMAGGGNTTTAAAEKGSLTKRPGGTPLLGRGQRRRRSMQHQQYFLMLECAPGYFWVDFFVQESKRFMVEQNLILFYPWCYYATQKYLFMRRGICRTYVRNGTKMYGNRNYYRPPLDEASKIIWKILLW
jgi:hypothetical protein